MTPPKFILRNERIFLLGGDGLRLRPDEPGQEAITLGVGSGDARQLDVTVAADELWNRG